MGQSTYMLVHFWPTFGGFHKRMEMLLNVLQKRATVERIGTFAAFLRLLISNRLHSESVRVLIYVSIMAPLILLLKLVSPRTQVYYMVRGDEVTYVKQADRHFRAHVAIICQKLLRALGCHFVFASEDLRVLFRKRLGYTKESYVLPNTLGKALPNTRYFDGRVALVGDFCSVYNIESALKALSSGNFDVHLFGNRTLPEEWQRPWLHAHGVVENLKSYLGRYASLVLFPYTTAGFPNVIIEALEAGCSCVTHREFPFEYLPLSDRWRFSLSPSKRLPGGGANSDLENTLNRLLHEKRDFKKDSEEFVRLIESSWEERVWRVFS